MKYSNVYSMKIKPVLRGLIAVFVAFTVFFTGFINPALAASSFTSANMKPIPQEVIAFDLFSDNSHWTSIFKGLINGALEAGASVASGLALCYAVDAAASSFFPPAAAASAFCPAIPSFAGGKKVVEQAVKVAL